MYGANVCHKDKRWHRAKPSPFRNCERICIARKQGIRATPSTMISRAEGEGKFVSTIEEKIRPKLITVSAPLELKNWQESKEARG